MTAAVCGVQRVLIGTAVLTCRLAPHASGRHVDTIHGVAWIDGMKN